MHFIQPFLFDSGNDPVDEDVDIGGNDPPISSYPPVEIEKDTALKNTKRSSSSSSSSGSGSSSSGLCYSEPSIIFLFVIKRIYHILSFGRLKMSTIPQNGGYILGNLFGQIRQQFLPCFNSLISSFMLFMIFLIF